MATEQPGNQHEGKIRLDRTDEEQDFVDQSKIDFDPDDGLLSGTAIDGSTEIPGPHLDNETGEIDMDETRAMAEGMDPTDTPAAKSFVARAAERDGPPQADREASPRSG